MLYKIKSELNIEYFEDGAVFYIEEENKFYALDEFASELIAHIQSIDKRTFTTEDLLNHFFDVYEVEIEQMRSDINAFLYNLINMDLLNMVENGKNNDTISKVIYVDE